MIAIIKPEDAITRELEDRMNSLDKTVNCPICGEPYVFMSMHAGDQSACPDCVAKARGKRGKHVPANMPRGWARTIFEGNWR
jgi:DNA-directed RNA polymerase subunit RPC12/RpoP